MTELQRLYKNVITCFPATEKNQILSPYEYSNYVLECTTVQHHKISIYQKDLKSVIPMGTLLAGLSAPAAIPKYRLLVVVNLKTISPTYPYTQRSKNTLHLPFPFFITE